MAKRRSKSLRPPQRPSTDVEAPATTPDRFIDFDKGSQDQLLEGLTGRLLATLPGADQSSLASAVASVRRDVSLKSVCSSKDFQGAMDSAQMDSAEVIVFEEFNVAVFKGDPDKQPGVVEAARSQGMIVEPEYWNHPFGMRSQGARPTSLDERRESRSSADPLDYLRGFRDGLSRAVESLESGLDADQGLISAADFSDSATATWGLQATGVLAAAHTGAGVRVAVLDSGLDTTHPDFAGRRNITSQSHIPDTTTDRFGNVITLTDRSPEIDQSGHGTHCIGTACGPRAPQSGPRYGIATDAEIFNGKVLSVIPGRRASGADSWIINGINWAIKSGCSIISLSLGRAVQFGDPISTAYESVANSVWKSGVLIVAAAGNDSDRDGRYPPFFRRSINPVASPANCPHIVAVAAVEPIAALDGTLRIANFSNRHMIDNGGEVNFCGPGVAILSSYAQPRYELLDGTSQATPHVAGIAALVQEQTEKKGKDLYLELRGRAIPQGSRLDYGNGLIHCGA